MMKKSEESNKQSTEEGKSENQDENQPQNTNDLLLIPNKISYNMNDLKTWDFNSADEVRQTMKAVFASKIPYTNEAEEGMINFKKGDENRVVHNKASGIQISKSKFTETDNVKLHGRNSTMLKIKKMGLRTTRKCVVDPSRKRPGRPPKAGPSKRMKKSNSSMYVGKLSNIVFSKRCDFESGSDASSFYDY